MIADRGTGRLLGDQIIGTEGVDKRADVLATAIAAGMTVEDLANLDLAYAPPFGSAKDPVIIAGMVAQNALRGLSPLITSAELIDRMNNGDALQIVDVRESYESVLGSLPDAVNMPINEVRGRLHELKAVLPTVLCDSDGHQAYVAARILLQSGFEQVFAMTGGLAWSAYQALPVMV